MERNEPTPETVEKLLRICHVARLGQSIGHLFDSLMPFRSVTMMEKSIEDLVAVTITGIRTGHVHSERDMPELGALLLALLTIFYPAYFNKAPRKSKALSQLLGTKLYYLYLFDDLSFVAVMVGARAGEEVRLGKNRHLSLLPEFLTVIRSSRRTVAARDRAVELALAAWDENAVRLGLATVLPRDRYEVLLREFFALFDVRYGHLLKRPELLDAC